MMQQSTLSIFGRRFYKVLYWGWNITHVTPNNDYCLIWSVTVFVISIYLQLLRSM